jgi:hypothetical protein
MQMDDQTAPKGKRKAASPPKLGADTIAETLARLLGGSEVVEPRIGKSDQFSAEKLARLLRGAGGLGWHEDAAPSISDEYDTPNQLAAELDVSVRTLGRWHQLRIGPPRVKIGRLILYPKAAKREWLASHASAPVTRADKRRGRC